MVIAGCSITAPTQATLTPDIPTGVLHPIERMSLTGWTVISHEPAQDVWTRMRAGFAMPDLATDLVQDREQWYASRPDALRLMTERSSKYLFHIVEELERRGMPTELALLPFVESAYNPVAVSSAKAAGMWQFMPATGTYFELTQNAFRDDRRDVLASTRAALDYLQKLYDMFGDWHLALAAYNWGEGSVGRAQDKNENLGLGTAYTELSMPDETRWYVPKLQALKNIVNNPQAYGVKLAAIGNHAYFESVRITRDIDVLRVAELAGVTEGDFRQLNPAYKGPTIFAAATPEILLPWDNAQVFKLNVGKLQDARLASWTVWTAPQRMAVSEVAKKVGVDETVLLSVNVIPRGMLIDAGAALLVPRTASLLTDVAADIAHNGQLKLSGAARNANNGSRVTVVARKGETVATLARKYKVSAADVARWNRVGRNAKFRTGQRLVIYRAAQPARQQSARK